MNDREILRKQVLDKRRQLTVQEQQQAAKQIIRRIVTLPLFLKAGKIAFYVPVRGELNLLPLLKIAAQRGKKCYLPALHCLFEKRLHFRRYRAGDRLIPNRYAILEPVPHHPEISLWALQIIFMPLVAFDLQGNRLGMGKGYYDRTFEQLKNIPGKRPYLIGLAYDCQKVSQISAQPWDVALDSVITESNFYCFT